MISPNFSSYHCKRAYGRSFRLDSSFPPQFQNCRGLPLPLTVKSKQTITFRDDDFHTIPSLHPSNNTVDALTVAVLSPHTYPSSRIPHFAIAHSIDLRHIHDKFTISNIQTPTTWVA